MAQRKPRIECYEPGQNVSLWLHRLDTERQLRQWPDAVAVAEASLCMGDVPLTWLITHCNQNTTWLEFEAGMRQRFGDSEQTIMARIQHRKQREDESVQSYTDDMNMLFAQSVFPEAMKRDLMLDNLKPSLRRQVLASIPTTIEQVIANATFLEDKVVGISLEKIKTWEQQRTNAKQDPVDRITRSMEKMTLAMSNNFNRQEPPRAPPRGPPAQAQPPRDPSSIQCWKCQSFGHKAADCKGAVKPSNYMTAHLLEAQASPENDDSDNDGYTPATIEAQVYATGGGGPLQRTPKNRTPWTPEGIKAARDARTNRGNPATGGSGARPAYRAPRTTQPGPRGATGPVVAPAPVRDYQRTRKAVDVIAQLDNQPMKVTYGAFLKEAPDARAELMRYLENCSKPVGRASNPRTPPVPRVRSPETPPENPRPFALPRATADNGPTPMETNFETEAFYHTDAQPAHTVNAVVKADAEILGKVFESIVDTGASDTVLSHSVVRRLGLMDRMIPSPITFLTAAGKTEKPMGMLPNLPVTLGSLCLHIDCMVTRANNYNVLVGNDWLRMAWADLLLSSGVLRVRLGPEQYEDIRIDTEGGPHRIHASKHGKTVYQAVQCLEHRVPMTSGPSLQAEDSDSESCSSLSWSSGLTNSSDSDPDSEFSDRLDSDIGGLNIALEHTHNAALQRDTVVGLCEIEAVQDSSSSSEAPSDSDESTAEEIGLDDRHIWRQIGQPKYRQSFWATGKMHEAQRYFMQPQNRNKTTVAVEDLCLPSLSSSPSGRSIADTQDDSFDTEGRELAIPNSDVHQILALQEITNECALQQAEPYFEDVEDNTHDLSDLSDIPVEGDDYNEWPETLGEELEPTWNTDEVLSEWWEYDHNNHDCKGATHENMTVDWLAVNSMQLAAIRDTRLAV